MLEKSGDGLDDCPSDSVWPKWSIVSGDGPCWIHLIFFLGIFWEVQQVKYPEESQRPEELGLAFPDLAGLL